jgi:cell division septation protein DedD
MLRTGESESEILLGNKQLLGIFFVIAVLLGVAFTGGYMVGRSAGEKKAASVAAASVPTASDTQQGANTPADPNQSSGAAETKTIAPDGAADTAQSVPASNSEDTEAPGPVTPSRKESTNKGSRNRTLDSAADPNPLGVSKRASAKNKVESTPVQSPAFAPQTGQSFLQVAAVGKDEAEAVADVLHRKGFRAHAVPKPGSAKIYRVLVGPLRDAGDLSTTRDSLRRTGFREVIVQRY